MAIGIVILAHEHLGRVAQVANALSGHGVRIAIHVDGNVDQAAFDRLKADVGQNPDVIFPERRTCEWGTFSLVEAGLSSAEAILDTWPNVTHVMQISGACLPLRRGRQLRDFLSRNKGRDFVESVPADAGWVQDGLSTERFDFFFPFSWKKQRWLFDRLVDLQRFLRVRRRAPAGLEPHLGSQWWCLTKKTLLAILNDPDRQRIDDYFRRCWIPDESYVPTLARRHSADLVSRTLTLTRFDDQGKPHLFYDDHAELLLQSDFFFVRKVWHGADKLYDLFLSQTPRRKRQRRLQTDVGLDLLFDDARTRRCAGRPGIRNAGRFPAAKHERRPSTARDYAAFIGFGPVFNHFETWAQKTTGVVSHGRLFQKDRVMLSGGAEVAPGNISANPLIRDVNPEQYLCNLLWANRGRQQGLMMEVRDGTRMLSFLAHDTNARLFFVPGAWMLELFHMGITDDGRLRDQALRLAAMERAFQAELKRAKRSDACRFVQLDRLLGDPAKLLTAIQEDVSPGLDVRPSDMPPMRDLTGLPAFLMRLSALGIDTESVDLTEAKPGRTAQTRIGPVRRIG